MFPKIHKIQELLTLAEHTKELSKDRSTKIAVFIIDENYTIRSIGYNGFVRGVNDYVDARHERPEKYYWAEHAERNSIYNAVRSHADIRDCWMLMTCDIPCADCARAIIQSGLKGIILRENHSVVSAASKSMWDEHAIRAKQMFEETGLKVIYL